jgi:hypothetical protein
LQARPRRACCHGADTRCPGIAIPGESSRRPGGRRTPRRHAHLRHALSYFHRCSWRGYGGCGSPRRRRRGVRAAAMGPGPGAARRGGRSTAAGCRGRWFPCECARRQIHSLAVRAGLLQPNVGLCCRLGGAPEHPSTCLPAFTQRPCAGRALPALPPREQKPRKCRACWGAGFTLCAACGARGKRGGSFEGGPLVACATCEGRSAGLGCTQ